jgi:hypothetical protein
MVLITGGALLLLIGYWGAVSATFGVFDKEYFIAELKEKAAQKEVELYELKKYFNQIIPINRSVGIELGNCNTLKYLRIDDLKPRFSMWDTIGYASRSNRRGTQAEYPQSTQLFLEHDLEINTSLTDSILTTLGWNQKTLMELKNKLDHANCIGIESGEPTKIRFQRSGLGMYSFIVFGHPMSIRSRSDYNDSCRYLYVSNKLALEYEGGAVGRQCFIKRKSDLINKAR